MNHSPARVAAVLAAVKSLVGRQAASDRQRALLERALIGLEAPVEKTDRLFFVELPLLVHAAIGGDEHPALPLAAATTLIYLGADIFDDLADGDRRAHWEGYSPAEINLAAASLLSALAPLAVANLAAPAERIVAMERTLASGLLRMAAGQQSDVSATGRNAPVRPEDVEAAVAGKSGEELAIFAALAAQLAGAPAPIVDRYAAMGRALGTGAQLASDCYELFTDPACRDLAHGTPTLPIALHLERLRGADRVAFVELLTRARTEHDARRSVREQLIAAGTLRHCAVEVEIYRQRALRELALAAPVEPAAGELRSMIASISFFPQKITAPGPLAAVVDSNKQSNHQPREEPTIV